MTEEWRQNMRRLICFRTRLDILKCRRNEYLAAKGGFCTLINDNLDGGRYVSLSRSVRNRKLRVDTARFARSRFQKAMATFCCLPLVITSCTHQSSVDSPARSVSPVSSDTVKNSVDDDADKALIQGVWKIIRSVRAGTEVPAEQIQSSSCKFEDDRWMPDRDENDYATFELDPGSDPKTIDIVDRGGNRMLGIYSLTGDNLSICAARAGEPRPSVIVSTADCNCFLIEMQRAAR